MKDFIVSHVSKTFLAYMILVYRYKRKYKNIFKTGIFAIKAAFKFYAPNKKMSKGKQIRKIFNKVKIQISENDRFIYNIDIFKTTHRDGRILDNITIDYSKILNTSLENMKENNKKMPDCDYKSSQAELLIGIEEYIDRECKALEKSNRNDKEKIIKYLKNIKKDKAESFEEALQRILFYNQMLWQVGHGLSGLGRLDKILGDLYEKDIKENKITEKDAKEMLKEFARILHQKFWYKSNVLMGDTGQIIILGGKEPDGTYFCNRLTYMFIEIMEEIQLPDPKVFLRITENVPRDLMELSLRCIKTGIGCPLFSNDDVIIPKLIQFGYEEKDAYNYVTAACWEPLVVGKAVEQNNIDSIVYLTPLTKMLENENLEEIKDYDRFLEMYKKYLKQYIIDFVNEINEIKWEEAPLLSLLTDNCNEKMQDVAFAGAKYNNYGVTSVSLGTVVNSIYNIKKFVYEDKKYTLKDINDIRKANYEGNEELLKKLKQQPNRYGTDNEEIVELTNEITGCVDKMLDSQRNRLGGKIKFGFSAPTYIIKAQTAPASFDGRKNGEPFGVHISSDKPSVAYTELILFAAKIDYDNHRFNGNVVDFMITPSFIEDNFSKMVDFLMLSIKLGFFQMQMNVTSSEILIKAKANPKEYENLIVRVWGFSAYFNDLPESYKDLLIERALKNEGKSI